MEPVKVGVPVAIPVTEPETKPKQEKSFIFRSKLPDICISYHLPLHSYCFENISQFSSRPCLINGFTGEIYTYAEVDLISRKVAAGLMKLGIQQGDVIMNLLSNSPEFVFAFVGASYRGAMTSTANPFYTPAEIAKQAKSANARLIVTQSCYVEKVKELAQENDIKIVCIDSAPDGCIHFSELTQSDPNDMPSVEISPDDIVALPFSSGTTGLPKGVFGSKYKVTFAPLVPPIVLSITKTSVAENYDLSSISKVMFGAAPMGKELEDAFRSLLPNAKLGQGYGMTEAGPVLSTSSAFAKEPFDIKMGSCGTVVRNSKLKILDPETGVSLPRNQPGEICIRGAQTMKGYLNDPEATDRTIDKECWLHTGDVGYIDNEDEIFIVDRLKEMIKYKGFQVAPAGLEAMLIIHPHISDAAVVSMKDEVAGEVPIAFVVKSKGCEITEFEIKQYIARQVVFYKRINRVFFVDAIPRVPSGKILRMDLRP